MEINYGFLGIGLLGLVFSCLFVMMYVKRKSYVIQNYFKLWIGLITTALIAIFFLYHSFIFL